MDKDMEIEVHPFAPFFPAHARVLMCGTFPARPERWSMNFYYPNFQNDMWRVFGLIFFNDKDYFLDIPHKTYRLPVLKEFLTKIGVALSDTGVEIIRKKGNAADKDLHIQTPINIRQVLGELPDVTDIITTGKLAAEVMSELTESAPPKMGDYTEFEIIDGKGRLRQVRHWRMPSTSRAYPASLTKKSEAYAKVLSRLA